MPLDPQVEVMLDQMAAVGQPLVTDLDPQTFREGFRALNAAAGGPATPAATEDGTVPGPDGDVPVRIYRPGGDGPHPLVVYLHGGGWVIGGIDTHDPLCQSLATGVPAVVVSADYRLAPEHPFPAALHDAEAVVAWAAAEAAALGADPARLVVAGDSAGGNLAAVLSRRARDAGGPGIALQVLLYPVTDLTRSQPSYVENGDGYMLSADMMAWFIGHYLGDADPTDPDASPLSAGDLSGLPPAVVVTAEFDPLRDEGEAYAARLRQAGVDVHAVRYDGMIHGFLSMDGFIDGARRALDATVATVRQRLAPTRA